MLGLIIFIGVLVSAIAVMVTNTRGHGFDVVSEELA